MFTPLSISLNFLKEYKQGSQGSLEYDFPQP